MSYSKRKPSPRDAQYGRFAFAVLAALREAVKRRTDEGLTRKAIADRIDMEPSSLTRLLNGRVPNITIKTISDVLWAAEFEPIEFSADALEDIKATYRPQHLIDSDCLSSDVEPKRSFSIRKSLGEFEETRTFAPVIPELMK